MIDKKTAKELYKALRKDKLTNKEITLINEYFFSFSHPSLSRDIKIILVLGSSAITRVQEAIAIYKKRKVKLLFSGGRYIAKEKMTEAERYYLYAICHGVNEKDMIIENKSKNTKENFLYSIPILAPYLKNTKKVLLITSSQHMTRALLTLNKHFKKEAKDIKFIPWVSYASLVPRDQWMHQIAAKKIIRGELERILRYHLLEK